MWIFKDVPLVGADTTAQDTGVGGSPLAAAILWLQHGLGALLTEEQMPPPPVHPQQHKGDRGGGLLVPHELVDFRLVLENHQHVSVAEEVGTTEPSTKASAGRGIARNMKAMEGKNPRNVGKTETAVLSHHT